jgi:hypothetical protein
MRLSLFVFLLLSARLYAQAPTIILSADPPESDRRAAAVLQHYLGAITNRKVEVVEGKIQADKPLIFIGRQSALRLFGLQQAPELTPDAYFLHGAGNVLSIVGGGDNGAEYGVYTLLEMLGCRKYSPQDSVLPHIPQLVLPDLPPTLEKPAFPYRELHYEPAYDPAWARWHKLITKPDKEAQWGMFVHTFDKLCPPEKFFASHPEFFTWNGAQYSRGQLCLSNDTVLQIVTAALRARIAERPAAKYWSVSQNDNYDYCKCARCAASDQRYGGPAGTLLAFVNKVAAAFPNKIISTLAYQYTRVAPKGIKPASNVSVCLCSIECDRAQPIENSCPDFARDIKEWSALTSNLMIWDYVVQFRSYISPFPNWQTLQPNVQLFKKHGVRMLFEQGSGNSRSEFSTMRAYLLAKLMWNPDVNADSIRNDFAAGYYGAAKEPVLAWIEQAGAALERGGRRLWIYDVPQNEAFLRPPAMEPALKIQLTKLSILPEGAKMTKAQERRHREACLPLMFALLEQAKVDTLLFPPMPNGREGWIAMLQAFVDGCKEAGIATLHENNYSPEQFLQDFTAFMQKQKAAGRSIAYSPVLSPAPSPKYAKGDPEELVNRRVGETDYRYNWLGFEGADMEATVQLRRDSFNRVIVAFLQDQASWVFFPKQIKLEISADGKIFEPLHEENIRILPDGKKAIHTTVLQLEAPRRAKYLRVTAMNIKKCPEWHPGNGNPCWIFADEVVVE